MTQPRYNPGDKIGGRYQVHQIKMGGIGEVYLCLDLEENYPYALKTFQQRYLTNPKLRKAFENEVATWVALEKHPNIVRCFYMDFIDNQPFMFLEWIASEESRGTDLRSWLRRGPLDVRTTLDFTIDICRGLIHAQKKQPSLVHRDLKPENILIAQGRLAKITDFGLAQIVQAAELEIGDAKSEVEGRQSLLGQGGIVGTPPYMAPEQWRGEPLDERTDIYAIGCILYEMLTGNWPFQSTTLEDLCRQHLEANIPKLQDDPKAISALDTLLASCLAKHRDERISTMNDLLQKLVLIYQQQFTKGPKLISISGEFTAIDYNNRGITYANLRRYEEAMADFGYAILLDPNYAPAYYNRGRTYHELRQYEEALTDCSNAIQLDSNFVSAYIGRGLTYHELQQYDDALSDYNQGIRLDPTNATVYTNRAGTHTALQQYEEALADYTRSIQLDPNFAGAYTDRGLIYANLQRYKEALEDYNRAIELNPTLAQAYHNRGKVYHDLQWYEKALADFNRAIRLNPNFAVAYTDRGFTYHELQRYDDALTNHSRAIHLDPNNAIAYYNRGTAYVALERYDDALSDFNSAIQLDPDYVMAYVNRGSTYLALQRYEEALVDYSRAIQLDPDLAAAHFNIGLILSERGKWHEALPYFEKAAQLDLPQGIQFAAAVRQKLDMKPGPEGNLVKLIFEAFQDADSVDEMRHSVAEFPFMISADFITVIEQVISQQVPAEYLPAFKERLVWLRQIANEQRREEHSQ